MLAEDGLQGRAIPIKNKSSRVSRRLEECADEFA